MCQNRCTKINELCKNVSNSRSCSEEFHLHCKATNDKDKVKVFSEFFAEVFTVEGNESFNKLPSRAPVCNMSLFSFSEAEVLSKLNSLKVDKSPGPDLIHPRILYELRSTISGLLAKLFNLSLLSGILPEVWKTSFITVIFKKGRKDIVSNYRPISLTCIVCKIMESIIRDNIMIYMLSNSLFSSYQYGFIKGRSTILQLLKIIDDWVNALDSGSQIDVNYTALKKLLTRLPIVV